MDAQVASTVGCYAQCPFDIVSFGRCKLFHLSGLCLGVKLLNQQFRLLPPNFESSHGFSSLLTPCPFNFSQSCDSIILSLRRTLQIYYLYLVHYNVCFFLCMGGICVCILPVYSVKK